MLGLLRYRNRLVVLLVGLLVSLAGYAQKDMNEPELVVTKKPGGGTSVANPNLEVVIYAYKGSNYFPCKSWTIDGSGGKVPGTAYVTGFTDKPSGNYDFYVQVKPITKFEGGATEEEKQGWAISGLSVKAYNDGGSELSLTEFAKDATDSPQHTPLESLPINILNGMNSNADPAAFYKLPSGATANWRVVVELEVTPQEMVQVHTTGLGELLYIHTQLRDITLAYFFDDYYSELQDGDWIPKGAYVGYNAYLSSGGYAKPLVHHFPFPASAAAEIPYISGNESEVKWKVLGEITKWTDTPPTPAKERTVSLVVKDGKNRAVSGVTVKLGDVSASPVSGSPWRYEAKLTEEQDYSFKVTLPTGYEVTANTTGGMPSGSVVNGSFHLAKADKNVGALTIEPKPSDKEFDFSIEDADDPSIKLGGIGVTAPSFFSPSSGTSAASGTVSFTGTSRYWESSVSFTFNDPNEVFASASRSVSTSGYSHDEVVKLTRLTTQVSFKVTDGVNPVSGATVSVAGQSKTTGADGLVSFTLKRGLAHAYNASCSGYAPTPGTSPEIGKTPTTVPVTLSKKPTHKVEIIVEDEDGDRVTGVAVNIKPNGGSSVPAVDNGDGTYTQHSIEGDYTFTVSEPNNFEVLPPQNLSVGAADVSRTVTLVRKVVPSYTIVVNAPGAVSGEPSVTINPGGIAATKQSGASGTFTYTVAGLKSGKSYTADVTMTGFESKTGVALSPGPSAVMGSQNKMEITLEEKQNVYALRFTVVASLGGVDYSQKGEISLVSCTPSALEQKVKDGFENGAAFPYNVSFSAQAGTAIKLVFKFSHFKNFKPKEYTYNIDGLSSKDEDITITLDTKTAEVFCEAAGAKRASLYLLKGRGATASAGTYTFANVEDVPYYLVVGKEGYEGQRLEVNTGETSKDVDLVSLAGPGVATKKYKARFRVVDAAGKGLSMAKVVYGVSGTTARKDTWSDLKGDVVVYGLEGSSAGVDYVFELSKDGYKPGSTTAKVVDGDVRLDDVQMASATRGVSGALVTLVPVSHPIRTRGTKNLTVSVKSNGAPLPGVSVYLLAHDPLFSVGDGASELQGGEGYDKNPHPAKPSGDLWFEVEGVSNGKSLLATTANEQILGKSVGYGGKFGSVVEIGMLTTIENEVKGWINDRYDEEGRKSLQYIYVVKRSGGIVLVNGQDKPGELLEVEPNASIPVEFKPEAGLELVGMHTEDFARYYDKNTGMLKMPKLAYPDNVLYIRGEFGQAELAKYRISWGIVDGDIYGDVVTLKVTDNEGVELTSGVDIWQNRVVRYGVEVNDESYYLKSVKRNGAELLAQDEEGLLSHSGMWRVTEACKLMVELGEKPSVNPGGGKKPGTGAATEVSRLLNEVKVYPLPFRELVNVSGVQQARSYRILNTLGVCMQEGLVRGASLLRLDVSGLPAGVYLLELEDVEGQYRRVRLVK